LERSTAAHGPALARAHHPDAEARTEKIKTLSEAMRRFDRERTRRDVEVVEVIVMWTGLSHNS